MKVAFLVGSFPALSETFILNQITGLIDRGHTVDIYARSRGDRGHAEVDTYSLRERTTYYVPRFDYVPRFRSKLERLAKVAYMTALRAPQHPEFLRSLGVFRHGRYADKIGPLCAAFCLAGQQKRYDIIHGHFGPNGLLGVFLRDLGFMQGKVITTFHGRDVNVDLQRIGTYAIRRLFSGSELFTSNTSFTAKKAEALGCPSDRIVRLPVSLNVQKYCFEPRQLQANEPVRLLSIARLTEKKGLEYAIRAVAGLLEEQPHLQLVYHIVGEGDLRKPLELLISTLGLSEVVKLLGSMTQEEVRHHYRQAHLFLLPSVTASDGDMEGQGLVLQEAQAAGLPVLSTLHNGIPEGVLDGQSGLLVPERDVQALMKGLNALIQQAHRWPEMGRAGRAFVEENFDADRLNDRLVELYESLINSNSCSIVKAGREQDGGEAVSCAERPRRRRA